MLHDCDSYLGVAGVVIYPILTLWTFAGMAFVAEEYFSVALDGLTSKYQIPDAVAGATILAVGTSFPELIIGFVSQFLSKEPEPSITLGVTLGSAIFNQLAIVGACALVAPGGAMTVSWRAMFRDLLFWSLTIVLSSILMADGEVTALDGWLMVGLYVIYVLACKYWEHVDKRIEACTDTEHHKPPPRVMRMVLPVAPRHEAHAVYVPAQIHKLHLGDFHSLEVEIKARADHVKIEEAIREEAAHPHPLHHVEGRSVDLGTRAESEAPAPAAAEEETPSARKAHPPYVRAVSAAASETESSLHHFHEDEGPLGGPFPRDDAAHAVWWVLKAPFSVVCWCAGFGVLRRRHSLELLALCAGSFVAVISYFMVQWLELSACLLGVPTITLSLLFAASGTCLPELIVAMVVAKKGQGTAAVSTALGSNVFDILIALGLPWAVFASANKPVEIENALALTIIMAGSTVVFLAFSLTHHWSYTRWHGYAMVGLYFLFNLYVILDAIPATNIPGPSGI